MAVTPRGSYQDQADGTALAPGTGRVRRWSARRARQQITPLGQAAGALGRPKVVLPGGVSVAELIEQMRPHRIHTVMSAQGGVRRRVVEFGKTGGPATHHSDGDSAGER